MFFENLEFYISVIIAFILNFGIVQPIFFLVFNHFYNQRKKIKKFYGEIYQINTLHFISKKIFFNQVKNLTIFFTILDLGIFLFRFGGFFEINKKEFYQNLEINLSLLISFIIFTITISFLIIITFYYKTKKHHISDEELVLTFQNFLKN
jgi:cbb3-type cytochrome oxidase subunit 3